MRNPLLATRLFGSVLMAHPEKAATVAEVFLGSGVEFTGITGDLMAGALDRANVDPFPMVDGIAVITIDGSLMNRGGYIGAQSGAVSYQGIQAQIARARSSTRVRAAILEVNSFGGEVQGVFETAKMIAALSAEKPTIAICSSNACSAGYLLASHARKVVAPEDGLVGSIGAVIMHLDRSGEFEQKGVRVTFVHAGDRKVDGNSAEPLPDRVREEYQRQVDATRDRFVDAVAKARGMSAGALYETEAACFYGRDALEAGLIDAIADPSEAFASFRGAITGG